MQFNRENITASFNGIAVRLFYIDASIQGSDVYELLYIAYRREGPLNGRVDVTFDGFIGSSEMKNGFGRDVSKNEKRAGDLQLL